MKLMHFCSNSANQLNANRWSLVKNYFKRRYDRFAQQLNQRTASWNSRQQKSFGLLVLLTGGLSSVLVTCISFSPEYQSSAPGSRLLSPTLILPYEGIARPWPGGASWKTVSDWQQQLDSLTRLDTVTMQSLIKKK